MRVGDVRVEWMPECKDQVPQRLSGKQGVVTTSTRRQVAMTAEMVSATTERTAWVYINIYHNV